MVSISLALSVGPCSLYCCPSPFGVDGRITIVEHVELGGLYVLKLAIAKCPPHGHQRHHEKDAADSKRYIKTWRQANLIENAVRAHILISAGWWLPLLPCERGQLRLLDLVELV